MNWIIEIIIMSLAMLLRLSRQNLNVQYISVARICHQSSMETQQCKPFEFNCACEHFKSGAAYLTANECIPQSWVCDAWTDCSNGVDERDCICAPGMFQCDDCKPNETNCIPWFGCISEGKLCDYREINTEWQRIFLSEGNFECLNNRDEYGDQCKVNEGFRCGNGIYIPAKQICDGLAQCADNSDESKCFDENQHKCPSNTIEDPKGNSINIDEYDAKRCDGLIGCVDHSDENNCSACPSMLPLPCACNEFGNYNCENIGYLLIGKSTCYVKRNKCDGNPDCFDHSDEWNCSCPSYMPLHCDCNQIGNYTCKEDKINNTAAIWLARTCYSKEEKCDGNTDCIDLSDEWNCSTCPEIRPEKCDCFKANNCQGNGRRCYSKQERCDTSIHCQDGSDELNCTCPNNFFTCSCFYKNNPICNTEKGCVMENRVNDGRFDCDSGNDEAYTKVFQRELCGDCKVNIIRLESSQSCRFPGCDNKTCYSVPSVECLTYKCNHTDVICTSNCTDRETTNDCNIIMQCEDKTMIFNHNFCNGRPDCNDRSDEIRNRPGFKCAAKSSPNTCVLPQWNLYDQVAHCYDRSDLCFDEAGTLLCFQCLDNRLIISIQQVCDDVIDCYDLSDECLCENTTLPICTDILSHIDTPSLECGSSTTSCIYGNASSLHDVACDGIIQCKNAIDETNCNRNIFAIRCQSKWGEILAVLCDGRPECKDFRDECDSSCTNTPLFCNDTCHSFYQLGDRYCDGYNDGSWKHLNQTDCPVGFDERDCPKRFKCKAGKKVSIDILQLCNGIEDCDDGSDEQKCPDRIYCDVKAGGFISISKKLYLDGKQDCYDGSDEFKSGIFSSPYEMIANLPLLVWFWIVAIITLLGNIYVVGKSLIQLQSKTTVDMARCNHLLALNLSASDSLMGIYLLILVIKALSFSGNYSMYDREWRTSFLCSLAGSLCVISSQTSCFMMSILTAYRLFTLFWPFRARRASTTPWKLAVILAWIISIILVSVSNVLDYFRHAVVFPNQFSKSDEVVENDIISFACRLASLTNTSMKSTGNAWETTNEFLKGEFPLYSPQGDIGYYGATSMCIPRYYVTTDDKYWIYSMCIITMNFISFSFVVISYIFIWRKMFKGPIQHNKQKEDAKKFHNRVTRLIVTDFLCWIPICVMAYLNISGITMPPEVDMFTAGVLLPINSALNPFLYSRHVENFFSGIIKKLQRKNTPPIS